MIQPPNKQHLLIETESTVYSLVLRTVNAGALIEKIKLAAVHGGGQLKNVRIKLNKTRLLSYQIINQRKNTAAVIVFSGEKIAFRIERKEEEEGWVTRKFAPILQRV